MIAVVLFGVIAVMYGVYKAVHYFFPTFGTIVTNALAGSVVLIDGMSALPWGSILDPKEAAMVAFGITVANMIFRLGGPKAAVGSMRTTP